MSKVFVNIGLSLDGYVAPEGMTMENWEYKNWGPKWRALMAWILNQQTSARTSGSDHGERLARSRIFPMVSPRLAMITLEQDAAHH